MPSKMSAPPFQPMFSNTQAAKIEYLNFSIVIQLLQQILTPETAEISNDTTI